MLRAAQVQGGRSQAWGTFICINQSNEISRASFPEDSQVKEGFQLLFTVFLGRSSEDGISNQYQPDKRNHT